MAKKKAKRVVRTGHRVTEAEAERLNKIRAQARKDFPPDPNGPRPITTGVGAKIRTARESRGLTWYAVAKAAGIPNPATVRDIEYGRDTKLSSVEAIASALGLTLDLVEAEVAESTEVH
jgi:ribosome-binding protein aMBF1 (putative translation factor)